MEAASLLPHRQGQGWGPSIGASHAPRPHHSRAVWGQNYPSPYSCPLPRPARHPLATLGMDFLLHKPLTLLLFLEPCMDSFGLQIGTWRPSSRFHHLLCWSYYKLPIFAPTSSPKPPPLWERPGCLFSSCYACCSVLVSRTAG